MELIIVNRQLSQIEDNELMNKVQKGKVNVYTNVSVSSKLESFSRGTLLPDPIEKSKINKDCMSRLLEFGEKAIKNETVTNLLIFEKASLWHYHKFRVYFFLRNCNYEILIIDKHIKEYQHILLYTENVFLERYYTGNEKVSIVSIKGVKKGLSISTIFLYGMIFFLRSITGYFQNLVYQNRKHIIVDHSIRQKVLSSKTLKSKSGNYNLFYLFEKIDKDFVILDDLEIPKLDAPYKTKPGSDILLPMKNRIFGEIVLLKGILSSKLRKELKKHSATLLNTYSILLKETQNPEEKLINHYIQSLHSSSKLFLFKYLSYRQFFSSNTFKSISTIDENNARIKTIIDAAKFNNIKTFGIQHGVFSDLQPAYNFTDKDIEMKIAPDFTFVWGQFWKDKLRSLAKYNGDSITLSGQLRTDIIPTLLKHQYSLQLPFKVLADNLVVFASQPQPDEKLRRQAAIDVFSAVKENKNIYLIVKLHPAEKNDLEYYQSIAKQTGCNNYQLILDVDLYLLLSKTNILITCFSTVGAEAIYFNKPFISLDHFNLDTLNYYKEGIAFKATNGVELKICIDKILNGELKIDKAAHQKYIEKYAYKIDGKVADRIIEVIKDSEY